jgi:hypothetical protein
MNNSITIFQKNWAFTSSNSTKPNIYTGTFGGGYVVTFTSDKFAAMAHIDDNTNVDSITSIFKKFLDNSVSLKDVKVIVLGGWKEHPRSYKWGKKIVKRIKEFEFKKVSTKNMYSKKTPSTIQLRNGIPESDVPEYYHYGASINASGGKIGFLKKIPPSYQEEINKQLEEFVKKYPDDVELPLTQVIM